MSKRERKRRRETRSAGVWASPFSGAYLTPPYYGPRAGAEAIAVVTACVNAIASAIASLPVVVFERIENGKRIERPDHPVNRMLRQPNALQSWPDLMSFVMGSVLLYGNALCTVEWDAAGQPTALNPLPWWNAQPILVPTQPVEAMGPLAPSARLAFDTLRTVAPWGGSGVPRRYFHDEVFYLRDRSDTGVLGVSRLSRAALALRSGLSLNEFCAVMWENGISPQIALTHPGRIGKEATDNIAASLRDNLAGPWNARKAIVLEEGMKAEPLSITPEDAELLASRKWTAEELCRVFAVPPQIVGFVESSSFANSAVASSWFASFTLAPWCKALEAEFSRTIFNDAARFGVEFDLSGLQRGDYTQRAQTMVNLHRAGLITANEARRELGYDPMAEGDRLMPQAVGGRPPGTADGEGERLPAPGAPTNGSGRGNGAAVP